MTHNGQWMRTAAARREIHPVRRVAAGRDRTQACAVALALIVSGSCLATPAEPGRPPTAPRQGVAHTQSTDALTLYDVFEINFRHHGQYANPFFDVSIEEPFRTYRTDPVTLPAGLLYVRGPGVGLQNADVYARRYSRAGLDLCRFSQRNNPYDLYRDLDHYLVQEAIMTDEILQHLHKHGFRVFCGLFGYQKVFNNEADNAKGMAKEKRLVKYGVDRWGAYVDFWQFLNEQNADDRWYAIMAPYLRSIDPYRHPIITSWQLPQLPGIEINAPHRCQNEGALESDAVTASRAAGWKEPGKAVILGD
jgi:hypothetical protein